MIGNDADDLADKISCLSVNERERATAASLPMIRQVTLPPAEEIKRREDNNRLSIETIVDAKASRNSLDSHSHSTDVNQHLYGISPRVGMSRPPKMSMGSVHSADSSYTRFGRSSTPCADNGCTSLNFVTTYVFLGSNLRVRRIALLLTNISAVVTFAGR